MNGYVAHPHDGIFFSLKKEVLTYATTWIKHEDNMPSGRNQSPKNPDDPLARGPLRRRAEGQLPWAGGREEWGG